ncbi:MAG: glycosyltransferase, partial [Verrucomicrobiota bacterium]
MIAHSLDRSVVAVVVTHRRPAEFQRLLESLAASTFPLLGCVVSDHAPTGEVKALAARSVLETIVLEDGSNPGPGAGWANAAVKALDHFQGKVSAIWYLDDDVVIPPDGLKILLEEMERVDAEAIAPLLEDEAGRLWAFPEPAPVPLRKTIRSAGTPADALGLLGENPVPFCWCTGACFLVKKTAVDAVGLHRTDFWMLGEDLEYSMRIAARGQAVFTCRVSVPHLPPPAPDAAAARRTDYLKFCSLLQNLSYLSFHAPHSRHMKSYLPGNYRRFFCAHGLHLRTVRAAVA